jgi:pyridoxal phosphate enzyme (YggS family)
MGREQYRAIGANYQRVLEQIERAACSVGRRPEAIRLVVVTKGHPVEAVFEALSAGIRVFGENYPEEGVQKMLAVGDQQAVEWHMIGHVQSRKAKLTAQYYDYIHSVDSLKLAERLERYAAEFGRRAPILLECNVSGEASKFGWPAWDEARWGDLLPYFEQIAAMDHLEVRGLMTMAPFFDEAEPARPYFRRLRRLQEFLAQCLPNASWDELSMGMSGDFPVAVQEGATLVRVGTAILGPRPDIIEP